MELLGTSKNVLQADSAKNALENFYSRRTEGAEKISIREQRATQRRFATARRGRSKSDADALVKAKLLITQVFFCC